MAPQRPECQVELQRKLDHVVQWLEALPFRARQQVVAARAPTTLLRALATLPPMLHDDVILAQSTHLRLALRRDVPRAQLCAGLAAVVQRLPSLLHIEALTLTNCGSLSAPEHEQLKLLPKLLPALRGLDLSGIELGGLSYGPAAFSHMPQLRSLVLSKCSLMDEDAAGIAAAVRGMPHLTKLRLDKNKLSAGAAVALAAAVAPQTALRSLSLAHNPMGARGYWHFARAGLPAALQVLDVRAAFLAEGGRRTMSVVCKHHNDDYETCMPATGSQQDVGHSDEPSGVALIARSLARCTALRVLRCGPKEPQLFHPGFVRPDDEGDLASPQRDWRQVVSIGGRLRALQGAGRTKGCLRALTALTELTWHYAPNKDWDEEWFWDEWRALRDHPALCAVDFTVDSEQTEATPEVTPVVDEFFDALATVGHLTRLRFAIDARGRPTWAHPSWLIRDVVALSRLQVLRLRIRDAARPQKVESFYDIGLALQFVAPIKEFSLDFAQSKGADAASMRLEDLDGLLQTPLRSLTLVAPVAAKGRVEPFCAPFDDDSDAEDVELVNPAVERPPGAPYELTQLRLRPIGTAGATALVDAAAAGLKCGWHRQLRDLQLDWPLSPGGTADAVEALPHLPALEVLLLHSGLHTFPAMLARALGPRAALRELTVQSEAWVTMECAETTDVVGQLARCTGLQRLALVRRSGAATILSREALQVLSRRTPQLAELVATTDVGRVGLALPHVTVFKTKSEMTGWTHITREV